MKKNNTLRQKKIDWSELVPFMLIIVLYMVLVFFSKGKVAKGKTLISLLEQSMGYIIGGFGMLFVRAMGQTDMSMGVNIVVSGTVSYLLVGDYGWGPVLIVCVLVGAALGAINGLIAAIFNVDTFMITIAMQVGLRGLVNVYYQNSDTGRIVFDKSILAFDEIGIKVIILAVSFLVVLYLYEFNPYGYRCRAIGENPRCAHESGINVKRATVIAFTISGLFGGLASLFINCRTGGMTYQSGQGYEMKILLGMFLGGMPVTGGMDARIYKVLVGIPAIIIITSGLNMAGASTGIYQLVEGLILLAILVLSRIVKQAMNNHDIKEMAKALKEDELHNPHNV